MKPCHPSRLVGLRLLPIAASLALWGCAGSPGAQQQAAAQTRQAQNPVERAQRTITNFTPALRCMDDMLFRNGTRDVTLMMEEMRDATQKVHVSARDMMTSAISEMTRRSRAVRLTVFGSDQQNLQQLLQQAQKTSPFAVLPEYNLRGTISQLDEDVRRESASLGLQFAQLFGLRASQDLRFSVVGFDSALVRTESMTLVPGVASKNTSVFVRRDSSAGDGQAGQSQGRLVSAVSVFNFSSARSEGQAQAARNLVELAAIELVGKLVRAPYWQCLGVEDTHPEVQRETEDWFLSMDEDERIGFVKERLRERRYFDGAIDASRSATFESALGQYRRAMGLGPVGAVDLAFFRQFVASAVPLGPLAAPQRLPATPAAGHSSQSGAQGGVHSAPQSATQISAPSTSGQATSAQAGQGASGAGPAVPTDNGATLSLHNSNRQANGPVQLRVAVDRIGYVYCYAQDPATQSIRRIFPNRFARDPRVEAGRALALPSGGRFSLPAHHRYACLHAPREVYGDLPPPLRWGDFDEVRLQSFEAIRQQFSAASGLPIGMAQLATR